MRLAMHPVPLVSILAGIGAAAVFKWLSRTVIAAFPGRRAGTKRIPPGEPLTWPAAAAIAVLLMLAVLSVARDFRLPGKEQQEIRKRDFAVWFWGSMERDHEVVSVSSDLKRIFRRRASLGRIASRRSFFATRDLLAPARPRPGPRPRAAFRGSGRWPA